MPTISPSPRIPPSPFHDRVIADGVHSFTVYNHTLLPTGFGDPEGEYWRLINGVSMWDVSCERQVELLGPDAGRLAQILAPRDLTKCKVGQGKYVAICDHAGRLMNDPILLKLADDRYWLSIADSQMRFWARAIAGERGLNVEIFQPDVSPLAVQGPKAEDVIASIFGDWVRDLRYFWFRETEIAGIPVAVQRSGWSKQTGFEIYLMDSSRGGELYDIVKEAGGPFDIGPGNPNHAERIESGLLSWGADTDEDTNPFEVRMDPYIDLGVPDDTVGIQALRRIAEEGPKRHQLGVVLDGGDPQPPIVRWAEVRVDGEPVGHMTNWAWSWRKGRNIGFVLVRSDIWPEQHVEVIRDGVAYPGTLTDLPFY